MSILQVNAVLLIAPSLSSSTSSISKLMSSLTFPSRLPQMTYYSIIVSDKIRVIFTFPLNPIIPHTCIRALNQRQL